MTKYIVSYESEWWECGDGCCSGENTTININDIEIGCYGDLGFSGIEGINKFIETLNKNNEDLSLIFKVELDEDGDLQDVIYLDDVRITDSMWSCEVYGNILIQLKLRYRYILYELDWDIWDKEKRVELVIEEDVFISS